MSLHNLSSKNGKKKRKRVGRGNSSGHGTYSTRGGKGQTARSGGTRRPGFEGGSTPLIRRMPKIKGFRNPSYIDYQLVNTDSLNIFDDNTSIDIEMLFSKNLIAKSSRPVKLLKGKDKLEKIINITVHKASKSAIKEVEASKGKVTLIERRVRKEEVKEGKAPAKEKKAKKAKKE